MSWKDHLEKRHRALQQFENLNQEQKLTQWADFQRRYLEMLATYNREAEEQHQRDIKAAAEAAVEATKDPVVTLALEYTMEQSKRAIISDAFRRGVIDQSQANRAEVAWDGESFTLMIDMGVEKGHKEDL